MPRQKLNVPSVPSLGRQTGLILPSAAPTPPPGTAGSPIGLLLLITQAS